MAQICHKGIEADRNINSTWLGTVQQVTCGMPKEICGKGGGEGQEPISYTFL